MIETRFKGKKLIGGLFVFLGFIGIVYLVWVYKAYPAQLPVFPKDSVLLTQGVPIIESGSGFAGLNKPLENSNLPSEIVSDETSNPGNTVEINRVLGTNDSEPAYNTEQLSLSIPRLGLERVKVALDVDGNDERIYNGILTKAIAHLKKSAYPGQFGNVFIFGHSRLPIFSGGGGYSSIFTDLPQIRVGDIVKLYEKGIEYTYQISQTGVVEPSDVFITNQPPTKKMITIMTCIPPGFASQRYITVGELIDSTKDLSKN